MTKCKQLAALEQAVSNRQIDYKNMTNLSYHMAYTAAALDKLIEAEGKLTEHKQKCEVCNG